MEFAIHFTWPDGTEDCIYVTGDNLDEIREKAAAEVGLRHGTDAWSEQVA